MDARTEINSTLPRRSSTSLISSLFSEEEKGEKKESIPLAIGTLECKTYGSTESRSHVKVYIWKPVYQL